VVGGQNKLDQIIAQIECYNPETDEWKICKFGEKTIQQKADNFPPKGHAVVVV